jgi:hypothetical protein
MSRDFHEMIAEVGRWIAPLEEKRREVMQKNHRDHLAAGACVVVGVLALLIFGMARTGSEMVGYVLAALCFGIAVILVFVAAKRGADFGRVVKWNLMRGLLDAIQPGLEYDPVRGISREMFRTARLFSQSADRYASEDLIRGRVGQTDIMLSEVHAEYRSTSTDANGRSSTSYHTFFRGLFVMADFHKHFRGTLRVLPGQSGLLGGIGRARAGFRPFSREKLVRLEDPEFDKTFVVYGSDDIEARYVLSPAMMRRILDLRNRWRDEVRLSFFESSVCVAISHPRNLFEPSIKRPVDCRQQLERIATEIHVCLALVEDLDLNTRIWSKE